MPAAQIAEPRKGHVVALEPPTPAGGEVLIEVRRAGVCGTDLHIWHGDYALARYPVVPGHEFCGVVAAVGEGIARVSLGERVTADPNIPCGRCPECQRNAFNQCLELAVVGVTRDGGFARYVVVPEGVVFPIGDLSFEEGALVEPLACVVWGLKRVEVQMGDSVLLFGAGPMGCLLVQALLRAGAAQVVVVDRAPKRLEVARALGAHHTVLADALADTAPGLAPLGFDVVVEATGIPAVLESAFRYARARGKIWVFGVAPESASASFVPFEVFRKDLKIIGSFALNKTFQEAIALIRGGAVKLAPLVSHVVPLERFSEGMHLAEHDPERMKVQFTISEDGDS
jgi:2-desacetyl-2-hydroxyethyl bacteriochlorophyllide A dehydrogenase